MAATGQRCELFSPGHDARRGVEKFLTRLRENRVYRHLEDEQETVF